MFGKDSIVDGFSVLVAALVEAEAAATGVVFVYVRGVQAVLAGAAT